MIHFYDDDDINGERVRTRTERQMASREVVRDDVVLRLNEETSPMSCL